MASSILMEFQTEFAQSKTTTCFQATPCRMVHRAVKKYLGFSKDKLWFISMDSFSKFLI